ncbi:hypothetical protein Tco_0499074 [Tanacetum coccineum]
MEVNIEEDENESELTYHYEEVDHLNPCRSLPDRSLRIGESSTAPFLREDNDGLLPGLMRRELNSLFSQNGFLLSRRLCVRSSVEQGTTAMEKMVEKLGNAKEKAECKKLKKKIERSKYLYCVITKLDPRIMPPKSAPLTQAAIRQMIKESVDVAIAARRACLRTWANVEMKAKGTGTS